MNISKAQERVLKSIIKFIRENSFPPSRHDIQKDLKLKSANAVQEILVRLKEKGIIYIAPHTARGIRIL